MGMDNNTGMFINFALSLLLRKIVVPTGYRDQVKAVKEMLRDDVSGLVDSLTDFAVDTSSVNFTIETENEEFTKILKKWLDMINIEYNGQIPSGIKPLAKEYFKERWKFSSFPILKISKWSQINGILVPSRMFFVDGESVYAKDKNEDDEDLHIINYDYYLGSQNKEKLDKNVIITRPYGRWYDKYPTPFLIKRGIFHNWKIIQSLKNKETEILDQIIPYLLLVKKGTEGLAKDNIKRYSNEELKGVIQQFQSLMDEMKSTNLGDKQVKAPMRATNFDEDIQHLIPDLSTIFNESLFAVAERNILSGLGFIDVVEATSTSRRESILNPKAFIEETRAGVEDFKQIIKDLIIKIVEQNKSHRKYVNSHFHISSSPVKGFMTDDFKEKLRQLYDRGRLSSQTAIELIAEVDFETEVLRREKESKRGIEYTMYPPIRENREGEGIDFPTESPTQPKDTNDDLTDDKRDEIERENYNISTVGKTSINKEHSHSYDIDEDGNGITSADNEHQHVIKEFQVLESHGHTHNLLIEEAKHHKKKKKKKKKDEEEYSDLEIAPYETIKDLPSRVKKNLSPSLQRVFLRVFNKAFQTYQNESRAFRIAWGVIKKIAKKGKAGKWVRKSNKIKITKAMLEEVLDKEEKQAISEAMELKDLEIKNKQSKLLDKLLNNKEDENI